jgi:two-component system chemotaxis response regulator CheB
MTNLVVIGASAGGVEALTTILSRLSPDLPACVLIVMHIGEHHSILPTILARHCALPVRHAQQHEPLLPGEVLVAPPDEHLLVERHNDRLRVHLTRGPKENHSRPAIDTLFRSAAVACGQQTIGVILTGYLDDGTVGLQAIKACGGVAIVQDPDDAVVADMPRNALESVDVDTCATLPMLAQEIEARSRAMATVIPSPQRPVPAWISIENDFARGAGDMKALKQIATPSPYSCPECGGALFQLNLAHPCRFRCHTGHSYTLLKLMEQQDETIEAALSEALRAFQEKENLAEQIATEYSARSPGPEPGFALLAQRARDDAALLRDLLRNQSVPSGLRELKRRLGSRQNQTSLPQAE